MDTLIKIVLFVVATGCVYSSGFLVYSGFAPSIPIMVSLLITLAAVYLLLVACIMIIIATDDDIL